MAGKPVTIFAKTLAPVTSEEGLRLLADKPISDANLTEYDSLLLPGAADIRQAIEDEAILSFIRHFDDGKRVIGAISIAPVLLVKSGVMGEKPFMAGINREELYEEGFSEEALSHMQGWDDNLKNPVAEGYIRSGNVMTSVSYEFVRFALAFGRMLGIDMASKTFGIRE